VSAAKGKADARRAEEDWLLNLADAKFERAKYSCATRWPAGFEPKKRGAIDLSD
jgi:hypothetical protein